jgi:hypothetical protein
MKKIGFVLLTFCCFSCTTVWLTLKSNPDGASVYLLPQKVWESDSIFYSNPANINDYFLKDAVTPVYTEDVNAGSYVAIFVLGDQKRIVKTTIPEGYHEDIPKVVTAEFK